MTPSEIICANTGDCRSVLNSGGKAIDLSIDHKPTEPKEKERLETFFGNNQALIAQWEVEGLSVTRGLGDHSFK